MNSLSALTVNEIFKYLFITDVINFCLLNKYLYKRSKTPYKNYLNILTNNKMIIYGLKLFKFKSYIKKYPEYNGANFLKCFLYRYYRKAFNADFEPLKNLALLYEKCFDVILNIYGIYCKEIREENNIRGVNMQIRKRAICKNNLLAYDENLIMMNNLKNNVFVYENILNKYKAVIGESNIENYENIFLWSTYKLLKYKKNEIYYLIKKNLIEENINLIHDIGNMPEIYNYVKYKYSNMKHHISGRKYLKEKEIYYALYNIGYKHDKKLYDYIQKHPLTGKYLTEIMAYLRSGNNIDPYDPLHHLFAQVYF